MPSTNFYAHIARTLQAQARQVLLAWPSASPAQSGTGGFEPGELHTGGEIEAFVTAMRQRLTAAQVLPGQRVLLLVPVSLELVGALLGVLAHGATVVLPPAGASTRQLLALARQGGVAILPRVAAGPRLLARLLGVKLLAASRPTSPATPAELPQPVPPQQPALITHTSGSTGRPKQIIRTHAVLSTQHAVLKEIFPPWPGQRDFPLFPNVLLHNLGAGAVSILPNVHWADISTVRPPLIVEQLLVEQVETLTGNVFYFEQLLPALRQQPGGFPLVRALGVGGSPVPERLVHALKAVFASATVYVIYGSSEAEPIAVRPLAGQAASPALGYCVGPVHPSLELRLASLGALSLPDGSRPVVGEIQVRGPHVASREPDGWLHTGDFGYLGADGQLYLTGRQGNEALRQGLQHYQLEHVLQHLPGVERVAARPVSAGFNIYVQGPASEAAVRAALAAYFPAAACQAVHFRSSLPVDQRHHSKIRYAEVL
ncbi:hypothetical protein GCM10023185_16790 [Hymenobacter saemangeumensis]|uniref:AMP-dependent synthetase/ligase domain-containing protein n=1 Tax=Hymenobacter saemangeumensis TaxID=1084522 RepID=A0ABP8IAV8_9BACT